jgi:predicted dehydrogenase
MEKIRWGIISTGMIANAFAIGANFLEDAEVVAVGSRSQVSADAFGEEHHIPRRYDSYEALANDPDVDVIYIGTPHTLHAQNTLMCLNAGKHVLCEKPFTINAAEAETCIQLAQEKGLFLMEAIWMRYIPAIVKLRQLVNDGLIGTIKMIQADFAFHSPFDAEHRLYNPALGGGSLLDVGIYPISFTTMLLGQPKTVHAHADIGQTGIDEQATMLFEYDNGVAALLSCGIHADMPNDAIVKGTKGYIRVHSPMWNPQRLTIHLRGQAPQVMDVPFESNAYNYEAAEVAACLRAGKLESDILPLAETLATMRLMDTLRASWGMKYPQE